MADARSGTVEVDLRSATQDDIPSMVEMHTKAFLQDQFSKFMLQGRPQGIHEAMMQRSIDFWLNDSFSETMVATGAEGQIVGWVCMVVKKRGQSVSVAPDPDIKDRIPSPHLTSSEARNHIITIMQQDSIGAEAKHMVENTYIVLQALATDPAWQGCGIGTRLAKWAIEQAEAQNLACWVHASPAAYGLYKNLGFVEAESNDYDLDAWASAEHKAAGSWETYTFRCMKRSVA